VRDTVNISSSNQPAEIEIMYHTPKDFHGYADATHKTRITFGRDASGEFFKCTDGGLTQFGATAKDAFDRLANIRGVS
jgi:hypothetical protein